VIYLAGKISKHDWRTQIFGERFGGVHTDPDQVDDELFNAAYVEDRGQFLYGGPFFVACDHGCSHGAATHGVGQGGCWAGDKRIDKLRARVLELNFSRIRRADYILSYINETDCFGTLVEIGYARALNKKLAIGIGPNISAAAFDDLWMARGCATAYGFELWPGTPQQVFNRFLQWIAA
jgi:hypothetical protein